MTWEAGAQAMREAIARALCIHCRSGAPLVTGCDSGLGATGYCHHTKEAPPLHRTCGAFAIRAVALPAAPAGDGERALLQEYVDRFQCPEAADPTGGCVSGRCWYDRVKRHLAAPLPPTAEAERRMTTGEEQARPASSGAPVPAEGEVTSSPLASSHAEAERAVVEAAMVAARLGYITQELNLALAALRAAHAQPGAGETPLEGETHDVL